MMPPYQCLHQCGRVLLAASLSRLDSYNIDDGLWLSSWTCPALVDEKASSKPQASEVNDFAPPTKKRRLSGAQGGRETTAENIKADKSQQRTVEADKQHSPTIVALCSTTDCGHVILVTAEDKSIRVFKHDGRGQLLQRSQRVMPKRPCAIALSTDEVSILCADKFGDVYSIPLLFLESSAGSEEQEDLIEPTAMVTEPSKPFIPAANDLTVHSIRNRRALHNQMRQKIALPPKSKPQFEHELLLGHVSMLTDIVVTQHNGQKYIVTADRDEHIRVSRGTPQAHVIEGYCLGHQDFVSRLCLVAGQHNLLISGGGDNEIYVWDWLLGRLLHKEDLLLHAEKTVRPVDEGSILDGNIEGNGTSPSEPVRIAVSNIRQLARTSNEESDLIMVTCEGIPALFIFSLSDNSTLSHYQTVRLQGNPLGLVVDNGLKGVVVSLDNVHEPGSIVQLRNDPHSKVQPLQVFQESGKDWLKQPLRFAVESEAAPIVSHGDNHGARNLGDLLYPFQKLRKTGGED